MKKYLPLYEAWATIGQILYADGKTPCDGLCTAMEGDDLFKLFLPTDSDLRDLRSRQLPYLWWGRGDKDRYYMGGFSPLRQNIVLLMAAMNGEL